MSNIVVYATVLALYLVLLIALGLWMGRRTKSAEDFYIGGRQVGPWVTAFSFVAAYFSSVVIVGGGATTEETADELGADGWAENAVTAAALCEGLVARAKQAL